ncbi:alpha-1,2-fucosyltransferase, partial [Bacteroides ovatus]
TDLDYTLCDWNPTSGKQNYLDMQLMSCAKHNVIANSTYSWWGAWLNENSDKIVIAPKRWFNKIVTPDILPEQWIKI